MILEARCATRPPPPPTLTFTFRIFFNFHLKNKVIYLWGSRRRRCSAHVSRSDAIGDAPAIAHKARGRSALWCAKCAYLRGPFVHCLQRDRGWHCDTFILGHFFMAPIVLEIRHRRRVHETRYYRDRWIVASFDFYAARPLCLQFQRIFLNTIVTSALSNVHTLLLK